MRLILLLLVFALVQAVPTSCQDLLINEVLAARSAMNAGSDLLEIYNPTDRAIDMTGYRFVLGPFSATVNEGMVPAQGFRTFHFDREPSAGTDHLALKLPRAGGTVLLVAPGGTQILDAFSYPELPDEVSFGRCPDGSTVPAYFTTSSFGSSCEQGLTIGAPVNMPLADHTSGVVDPGTVVSFSSSDAAEIWYTLDGSSPNGASAERYVTPFVIQRNTVIRSVARSAGRLPGPELTRFFMVDAQGAELICQLAIDPKDLWDAHVGINVDGSHGNFSRSGREWEREGRVTVIGKEIMDPSYTVGVRIAGSGTRSYPKRSFKMFARARFGPDSHSERLSWVEPSEVVLRADATPHAFLRNLFLEEVITRASSRTDVQSSRPIELYLNDTYWGLYRSMASKDPERIVRRHEVEAVDMLSGPSYQVISGSRDKFDDVMVLLGKPMLTPAEFDSLRSMIEVESLIDLAVMDLYSGRADHDLNVRVWRPRVPGSKWRWMLFDMDLWADPDDNSLARLLTTGPMETPYMRTILSTPIFSEMYLARSAAFMNTLLAPEHAERLVAAIFEEHHAALERDHARWAPEMDIPDPMISRNMLLKHVERRPKEIMGQLAGLTAHEPVNFKLSTVGQGRIHIEGLPMMTDQHTALGFAGVPMLLEAVPAQGMRFMGWKGVEDQSPMIVVDPLRIRHITAQFAPALPSTDKFGT